MQSYNTLGSPDSCPIEHLFRDRHIPGAMHSASGFDRIAVAAGVERRKRWSLAEKLKAVEESRLPGMTVSCLARKYGIAPG